MSINNLEKFRSKLASGKTCFGMVITLSDPCVSELAGEIGYDFTWIDAEHCALNIETVLHHVMAIRGSNCAPLIRVQWNQWGVIKPMLDIAPAGIIIPMVNSREEAVEAVASCKYPPQGNRGCGPRRGRHYGMMPFDEYLVNSASDPMVILQIEHIDAVKNLDEILSVSGIDSICIGPTDLSGSMGKFCQFDDPDVKKVIDEISAKVCKAGILLGAVGGDIPLWQSRGVGWIAMAGDGGSMASHAKSALEAARESASGNYSY